MKNYILYLIFLLLLSCGKESKPKTTVTKQPTARTSFVTKGKVVNFSEVKIKKGSLGPIALGTHIADYKTELSGLKRTDVDAFEYGYDGGGNAALYSYNNQELFALMPARDTDSIIAIMVLHKDFKSEDGISPGIKVKEILGYYGGNLDVNRNLMTGGEFMFDGRNNWVFIFETSENSLIGKYSDIDGPGTPYRITEMCSRIEIK